MFEAKVVQVQVELTTQLYVLHAHIDKGLTPTFFTAQSVFTGLQWIILAESIHSRH